MIKASTPELKNVRMASVGEDTIGSPRRLKEVFITTGTPGAARIHKSFHHRARYTPMNRAFANS